MKRYNLILISLLIVSTFWSCDDFLDEEPVDSITGEFAITDLQSAQAAIDGLYDQLNSFYSDNVMLERLSSMCDEQNERDPGQLSFNTLDPTSPEVMIAWDGNWGVIFSANNIINKLLEISSLSTEQKNKFIAEARFVKSLEYLLLMQFFGEVPWQNSTDFRVLKDLSRTPVVEIYDNIIRDLKHAEQWLPDSYDAVGGSRARIIKPAATALLARIYLYQDNWVEAEKKATEIIENPLFSLLPEYQNVFKDNSEESILEHVILEEQGNTIAEVFLPSSLGGFNAIIPTRKIIDAFENEDLRKDLIINSEDNDFFVSKYKELGTNQEIKILRLAEMYLIRAEARVQQGDLSGSSEDLNVIRARAGLEKTIANDKTSLLSAIEQERFIELSFEGHRWIDLVRTGRVDEVMSSFNPSTWQSRARLLPIPITEIELNPNLTQNPGY